MAGSIRSARLNKSAPDADSVLAIHFDTALSALVVGATPEACVSVSEENAGSK
jgi:hypothetical protein